MPKTRRIDGRTVRISKQRILQISNDISEDMCSATKKELIETVKYFRNEFDTLWQRYLADTHSIGLDLVTKGLEITNKIIPLNKGKKTR